MICMNVAEVEKLLSIPPLPLRWTRLAEEVEESDFISLGEEWLQAFEKEYHLFPSRFPEVLTAAGEILENKALCTYVVLLQKAMWDREAFRGELPTLKLPTGEKDRPSLGFDYLSVLAVLPHIGAAIQELADRGVSAEMITQTYMVFEGCLQAAQIKYGRPRYHDYFGWTQLYIDGRLLRIGRLEFEMLSRMGGAAALYCSDAGEYCLLAEKGRYNYMGYPEGMAGQVQKGMFEAVYRETEEYYEGCCIDGRGCAKPEALRLPKTCWSRVCGPEDPVVNVHIPKGPGLTRENVMDSYRQAEELYARLYPEFHYRAFHCYSWLMDPQLSDMLPPASHIVAFQSDYMRVLRKDDGRAVFNFLFPGAGDVVEKLPENTCLERAVKGHMLAGNYIYGVQGIMPCERT